MTYPMDEYPQAIFDTAASHFGPGDVDPYLVTERAQLIQDQQWNEVWEQNASSFKGGCVYPATSTAPGDPSPEPRQVFDEREERRFKLLDDQEEAFNFLFTGLSYDQGEALLTLAEDSGVDALDQLLDALRKALRQDG